MPFGRDYPRARPGPPRRSVHNGDLGAGHANAARA